MSVLTLESLKALTAPPLKAHLVPVPELSPDAVMYVAELTADERDGRLEIPWAEHCKEIGQENNAGLRAFMVAACWCDQSRAFVATDAKAIVEVAKQLGTMNSAPITRLFNKCQQVNAIGEEEVKELEKN